MNIVFCRCIIYCNSGDQYLLFIGCYIVLFPLYIGKVVFYGVLLT